MLSQVWRVASVDVLARKVAQQVDRLQVRRYALGASQRNNQQVRAAVAQALQHPLKLREALLAAKVCDVEGEVEGVEGEEGRSRRRRRRQ